MSARGLLARQLVEVAPLVQSGQVSPPDLVAQTLDLIQEINPRSGSFITLLEDRARADARTAEAEVKRGLHRGALHGIPYSIKDNIATRGVRSTAGSIILSDYVPTYDSTVAERGREAGGILVGKTNLHEWALGSTNDNPHFGRAGNPWALGHIPGGSSGGSAAAVALGLSYVSIGTDGAGSVRMPASLCGVVGLKATYGLISRHGMIPAVSPGHDHGPGILARSVRDAALVLNVLGGHDPRDPASLTADLPNYASSLEMDITGLRVGMPTNYFFDVIDPEVDAAVRAAVDHLGRLGADIQPVRVPLIEEAMAVSAMRPLSEFHRAHLRARRQGYGDDLRYRLIAQEFTLASDVERAAKVRNIFRAGVLSLLSTLDALVSPTMCIPAYPFDAASLQIGEQMVDLRVPGRANDVLVRLTRPANMAGIPAISVPCGFTRSGLPIGLQIMGKPLGESTILALGHQYGAATGQQVCGTPPLAAVGHAL